MFVTFIQLISNCHRTFYFFINSFYFIFLFWLLKESEWVVRSRVNHFPVQCISLINYDFILAVFELPCFLFCPFISFYFGISNIQLFVKSQCVSKFLNYFSMLGFFFPSLAQNIFATLHLEDVCTKSDPQFVKVHWICYNLLP